MKSTTRFRSKDFAFPANLPLCVCMLIEFMPKPPIIVRLGGMYIHVAIAVCIYKYKLTL